MPGQTALYKATRHLLGLQHKRIAYLAGYGSSKNSRVRRNGIELALAEAGLQLSPEWCPTSFPNKELSSEQKPIGYQPPTGMLSHRSEWQEYE